MTDPLTNISFSDSSCLFTFIIRYLKVQIYKYQTDISHPPQDLLTIILSTFVNFLNCEMIWNVWTVTLGLGMNLRRCPFAFSFAYVIHWPTFRSIIMLTYKYNSVAIMICLQKWGWMCSVVSAFLSFLHYEVNWNV